MSEITKIFSLNGWCQPIFETGYLLTTETAICKINQTMTAPYTFRKSPCTTMGGGSLGLAPDVLVPGTCETWRRGLVAISGVVSRPSCKQDNEELS